MLEAHRRFRRETYCHIIHRTPAKKVDQDVAYHIFYHEFGILHLVWRDFKEPVITLHMYPKNAHS
jgi:hypothetical protein